ncbi:hypothetical protein HME9302_01122 [Alteripontixanthobacter maritimus]|uniref:Leucine-binding protein domain-containing protein n=1 Tax=Alteripontixanthobacter maritimus TaxID=2161824 RepID=A0A369Q8P7_9SPHN|nr:penicillin-binding protein activator [Alteripontixanthobacter maritimus]RDC59925.1 hypothetical protein HME9302_01122 [Alteripontixanthobacter maritimus]
MMVGAALLGACQIIPDTSRPGTSYEPPRTPPPVAVPVPAPPVSNLPQDAEQRHRIALLVPTTGRNASVGLSIANAATMALLDTNAANLRITTYDTATGASSAAARAMADGNALVLGPLMPENVAPVLAQAKPAGVTVLAFSNDGSVARPDVFMLGQAPEQSIARTVAYARERGSQRFAAILPEGGYGDRAEAALSAALLETGATFVRTERYARSNTSIMGAATRLNARGGFDTVLLADNASLAKQAADILRPRGTGTIKVIGTELWSGVSSVTRTPSLRGAWFSAISDSRFKRFSDSFEERFGERPYRVSTLGYDAVLLTLRVAQDWRVGEPFPIGQLYDRGGFLGLDGVFRFDRDGMVDRAMEVREIRGGSVVEIDPAPTVFRDAVPAN